MFDELKSALFQIVKGRIIDLIEELERSSLSPASKMLRLPERGE